MVCKKSKWDHENKRINYKHDLSTIEYKQQALKNYCLTEEQIENVSKNGIWIKEFPKLKE